MAGGRCVSFARLAIALLLLPCLAIGAEQNKVREARIASVSSASHAPGVTKVYIVQLRTPSAAEFHAVNKQARRVSSAPSTLSSPGKLDRASAAIQSYTQQLMREQQQVLASVPGTTQTLYNYRYSLNGFAARMSPGQADRLRKDARVLRVWEDEIRPLSTRTSPAFLGLFDRDGGLRGPEGLTGENVIIGVIDSGVAPSHPALLDTQEADQPHICTTSFGEFTLLGRWLCREYRLLDDQIVYDPPANWSGICQTGEGFTEDDCNNKMIGARYFVAGAQMSTPLDSREVLSPQDVFGHGTHVATTAAGNRVSTTIFGTALGRIEGVAPRARIATYKACWIRVGEVNAGCNASDLANAIDTAVADGVDVINYSVGSSMINVIAPDDIAILNAAKAGVLTIVAAGNDGPNLTTIGSPAGNPAALTVAASSRDGKHELEALQIDAPASVAGRYAVREASFTPNLADNDPIDDQLILVDDNDTSLSDGSTGTTMDACESLVNGDDVSGRVALIQRGGCEFDIKIQNAGNAGAIAAVVYNIAGDPIVMNGDSDLVNIPAVMIGQADGNLLVDELEANNTVEVLLDKGLLLEVTDEGNVMGAFSGRGPGPVRDVLKPDVTAPGINILAGMTPATIVFAPDEDFGFLTGTSMATPHVTGTAALLLEAHPDWTPAALKSALSTSARQDVLHQDGVTNAHPFDFGSGHIVPNAANDPGVVFLVENDGYDAYSCGVDSPDIDQATCDALTAAGRSTEAFDMNLPSIAISELVQATTVTRTVTNVGDQSENLVANVVAPVGINVQVVPSSLSVAPGNSATFDTTISFGGGIIDSWHFGSIDWSSNNRSMHVPLAVRPVSISAPEEVSSAGGSGNLTLPVLFGYTGTYTPGVHGLDAETRFPGFVDQDPQQIFSVRQGNGVNQHVITVSPNQALLRFWLRNEFTDGNDDLDMYVYFSPDGAPNSFVRIGESGNIDSDEEFQLFSPTEGVYAVLVHGFATDDTDPGGAGANYELLAWEIGFVEDRGNMTANGPPLVNAGDSFDVMVDWTGLGVGSVNLGLISHQTPQGISAFTIVNIRN